MHEIRGATGGSVASCWLLERRKRAVSVLTCFRFVCVGKVVLLVAVANYCGRRWIRFVSVERSSTGFRMSDLLLRLRQQYECASVEGNPTGG